jgi:hypothetical protein
VRRLLILVALAVAAGAVVYVVHPGAGPTTAAQYRHYLDMGKRICRRVDAGVAPTPVGSMKTWSGLTTVATILRPGSGVPVKYRSALEAGCSASA